jgi:U32 family peptidase
VSAAIRTHRQPPELLAPAGGPEALRAAVANGADAVYLGLSSLNARRGAPNFTVETLAEATRFAHLRDARVYLTANIAVLESEMRQALETVAAAWQAGVDAVIVQDLGLLSLIRRHYPEVRIHASTQIDAHNAASVRALAEMGVSRVTLARELSVAEIAALAASSPVELESFVHGSLCFCHSGQCLLSSVIGGRSANRGLCAQPCRLPYALLGPEGQVAEVPGGYLLSPKDLAGITLLPALVRSGLAALKIEGRMKSPEYVATVVSVYRAALDRAAADGDGFSVRSTESDLLAEAFSRGFTEGYLADVRGNALMSYQRPNNRGVSIGRVVESTTDRTVVELTRAIEAEDTLEFWTGAGRVAGPAGQMRLEGRHVTAAPAGARVALSSRRGVRPGDRVFRVANAAMLAAARRTFAEGAESRTVPLEFDVAVRIGETASVTARARGHEVTATGAIVEPARTKSVSAAEIMEHVGRLGGTPYEAASFRVDLSEGAGIGFSELHALRRQAIERLEAERLARWRSRTLPPLSDSEPQLPSHARAPRRIELVVAVSEAGAATACLAAGADRVLVAATSADPAAALPDGVEPLLPRVAHEAEIEALLARATSAGSVTCGNLGLLAALRDAGVRTAADWGLNVLNPWSAEVLAGLGAAMVWASPELSGRQLATLASSSPVPVGVVVFGRLELMVAEHCVLQAAGECGRRCDRCDRRRGSWVLRDRKGYEFPVTTDATGRAHLYNSVRLDLVRPLDEVVAAGVAAVRLELHTETAEDAARLTSLWRRAADAVIAGAEPPPEALVSPATTGHFFRGVR